MKNLISRLLLLATGILCLGCGTPVQSQTSDNEKIETLQKALKSASEKSEPVTIEAAFSEALQLINLATKAVPGSDDGRFGYAEKTFFFKDDGPGKESSHILYGKTKVVLFVPEAKKK